jgi:hypothetical protein
MDHIEAQIKHALENQDELIKMFAAEPEGKLADRLNIIHLQYVICEKENDLITGEFLEIMRRIIIEARLYKWDNNIADEFNEMQQELTEMKLAEERLEHRKKTLAELSKPIIPSEPEETKPEIKTDNNVQLGLF